MRFHHHYGIPERLPTPFEVTPALYAHLTALTPHLRVLLLTQHARDDFHERFPVIGQFGGARGCGSSDRAWIQHGQSYIAAAWESYFRAEDYAAVELPVSRAA